MYFKPFFATLVVALTAASSVQAISGDATHFTPNDKKGACGVAIPNTEHAVGLSPGRFMNGAACGKKIKVHHDGKTVEATVRDKCASCTADDVNLTRSAFKVIAPPTAGRIAVTWNFE